METTHWDCMGRKLPKTEVTFFSQVIIIYIVIITCILNLSFNNGDSNLWTALMSASLGYILPSPKIKSHHGNNVGSVSEKDIL